MHPLDPNATARGDAMRMIVLAEEIGRSLSDSDKSVLAMALTSAAATLDIQAARWRLNALPTQ